MEGRPASELKTYPGIAIGNVARLAYAAGADAELEACCETINTWHRIIVADIDFEVPWASKEELIKEMNWGYEFDAKLLQSLKKL